MDHIEPKNRKRALEQHRWFEGMMGGVDDGILHFAVRPPHTYGLPRQQVAHLIVKYCHKWHTSLSDLLDSITKANGNVSDPKLMKPRATDNKTMINLLSLSNDTLWRVYCSIPVDCRPPERPKQERDPSAPPRKQKRRVRFDGTYIVPKRVKKEPVATPPTPVFREVCWVCCDLCEKWRRIPGREEDLPDRWACIDHPAGITCETPEDNMDEDEKWDGATRGREHEPLEEEDDDDASEDDVLGGGFGDGSQGPSEEGVDDDTCDGSSDVPPVPQGAHVMANNPEAGGESDGDSQVDESDLWGDDDGDGF